VAGVGFRVNRNGGGGRVRTDAIQVGTDGQYTDGQWHHIALTRSGATLIRYIDGVAVGTSNYSDPIDLSGGNNNYLGKYAGNNFFWNGQIDEVEVFNRALTATDVASLYIAGSQGKCPCTPAPDGMISWWRAEGDAVDTKDGNDGTFNGTPAYSAGEVGQAISFDGNSYVRVPDNTNLHFSSQFTLDAWVYPTDLSGAPIIFSKFGASNFTYELHLQSGGSVRSNISGDGTTYDSLISDPGVVSTNSWAHVTTTFNAGDWRIYVNGVQVASKSSTVTSIYP